MNRSRSVHAVQPLSTTLTTLMTKSHQISLMAPQMSFHLFWTTLTTLCDKPYGFLATLFTNCFLIFWCDNYWFSGWRTHLRHVTAQTTPASHPSAHAHCKAEVEHLHHWEVYHQVAFRSNPQILLHQMSALEWSPHQVSVVRSPGHLCLVTPAWPLPPLTINRSRPNQRSKRWNNSKKIKILILVCFKIKTDSPN